MLFKIVLIYVLFDMAAMAEGMGKQQVLAAVADLSASLCKRVKDGRERYRASGEDINNFVKSDGMYPLYPVQLYAECFQSLEVKSRQELESLWTRYFSDEDMRSCVEELLSAEAAYRACIEELDQILTAHEVETALPVTAKGEHLLDATFIDGRTGDSVSLNDLLQKSPCTLFVLRKHYA